MRCKLLLRVSSQRGLYYCLLILALVFSFLPSLLLFLVFSSPSSSSFKGDNSMLGEKLFWLEEERTMPRGFNIKKPRLKQHCHRYNKVRALVLTLIPGETEELLEVINQTQPKKLDFQFLTKNANSSSLIAKLQQKRGDRKEKVTESFSNIVTTHPDLKIHKVANKEREKELNSWLLALPAYWFNTTKPEWMASSRPPLFVTMLHHPVYRYIAQFNSHKELLLEKHDCIQTQNCSRKVFNFGFKSLDDCAACSNGFTKYHPCVVLGNVPLSKHDKSQTNLNDLNVFTSFFCGYDPKLCFDTSDKGMEKKLAQALLVLQTEYAFVGINERFEESVYSLCETIPTYFSKLKVSLMAIHTKNQLLLSQSTTNVPRNESIEALSKVLRYDLILYKRAESLMEDIFDRCSPYPPPIWEVLNQKKKVAQNNFTHRAGQR